MVEKMVSLAEAAEIVGVHPVTLRRLIKKGELRATRVGRQWRVPLSDLTPSYQQPAEEPQGEGEGGHDDDEVLNGHCPATFARTSSRVPFTRKELLDW